MQKNITLNYYYCFVCGSNFGKWITKKIVSDDLARSWKLSKELREKFDHRESDFLSDVRKFRQDKNFRPSNNEYISY